MWLHWCWFWFCVDDGMICSEIRRSQKKKWVSTGSSSSLSKYDRFSVLDLSAQLRYVRQPETACTTVITTMDLKDVQDKLSVISQGFRQRVGLAQSNYDPEILVLDEPVVDWIRNNVRSTNLIQMPGDKGLLYCQRTFK